MKRKLSVIDPASALRGAGPESFERLARTARTGSSPHRGLIMITLTLASRAVSVCVPPSGQAELLNALECARLWVNAKAGLDDARRARALCFGAVGAIENLTADAVNQAKKCLPQAATTPLDPHADHVVERYVRLAAHFAVSAVCHCLDALKAPDAALEVLEDVKGARAYQLTGLGPARHAAFRNAALNQAAWEAARNPGEDGHTLAAQIFHEYLGGRWRAHADAVAREHHTFITWALSAREATG